MVRWPGEIPAGQVINDIFSMEDWVPTLMAAVGEPDIKEKLKQGHRAEGKIFKVHLDGYNQLDLLKGNGPGTREEIFYFDDTGSFSNNPDKRYMFPTFNDLQMLVSPMGASLNTVVAWLRNLQALRGVILGTTG